MTPSQVLHLMTLLTQLLTEDPELFEPLQHFLASLQRLHASQLERRLQDVAQRHRHECGSGQLGTLAEGPHEG